MTHPKAPLVSFASGFLVCHVYLHLGDKGQRYFDTVLFRKLKGPDGPVYKRGANLKPTDLSHAILILSEAQKYLDEYA